jgi:putative serine/threonine protein kinase
LGEVIPLERLLQSRASLLICYPTFDVEEAERRLRELRHLRVEAVELRGRHQIRGLKVLGKGHVGVVVAVQADGVTAALKIRRVDADRDSFCTEAEHLRLANGVSVGPRLLAASANFLLMEMVEGDYLADWVDELETSDSWLLRLVLRRLFDKAEVLDRVGLDHGELSRAHRHVIVSESEPRIIDFESASVNRRAANVTSIVHYTFFNGRMRNLIGKILPLPDREMLIEALRRYRRSPIDKHYDGIIAVCNLNV